MHIAANAATTGEVSDEDRAYLANLVATRTGVPTEEARKSAAAAALYTALALLIGAFIASVSAAIGGRLRDEHL